ncbi:hypothetical protein ACFJIW_23265 [Tahibacter sp. UC22_41]|uniref:hypothetical protein n=1 Tax=Tahibacter sp. UC22_41 TaxID=3350178 RepID=UPI0036D9334F
MSQMACAEPGSLQRREKPAALRSAAWSVFGFLLLACATSSQAQSIFVPGYWLAPSSGTMDETPQSARALLEGIAEEQGHEHSIVVAMQTFVLDGVTILVVGRGSGFGLDYREFRFYELTERGDWRLMAYFPASLTAFGVERCDNDIAVVGRDGDSLATISAKLLSRRKFPLS